jgi:hypothetical protein
VRTRIPKGDEDHCKWCLNAFAKRLNFRWTKDPGGNELKKLLALAILSILSVEIHAKACNGSGYHPMVSASNYADLRALEVDLASCDASDRPFTVLIDKPISIGNYNGVEILDYITLKFEDLGTILSPYGYGISISGAVIAPPRPIFPADTRLFIAGKVSRTTEVLPEWWGAIRDDGQDDWQAIQGAIDGAVEKGAILRFSPGRYNLSAGLLISNPGEMSEIIIKGEGTLLLTSQPNLYPLLKISNGYDASNYAVLMESRAIRISGIFFGGRDNSAGADNNAALLVEGATNLFLSGLIFQHFGRAVHLRNCDLAVIESNIFKLNRTAILQDEQDLNSRDFGNSFQIQNNKFLRNDTGIVFSKGYKLSIQNNEIVNSRIGIYLGNLTAGLGWRVTAPSVVRNRFESNEVSSIVVGGLHGEVVNAAIQDNNVLAGCGENVIVIGNSLATTLIKENYIKSSNPGSCNTFTMVSQTGSTKAIVATPVVVAQGTVTYSGQVKIKTVTLPYALPDNAYNVIATPHSSDNATNSGAFEIKTITKSATAFSVELRNYPGSGNIGYTWMVLREY